VAEVTAITKAIKKLGKASNTELRTLIEPLGPAKKKGKTLSETDFKTLWTAHQKRAEEFMAQAEAAYSAVPADRLPPAQKEAIIAGYQEKLALALEPADDVYAACMAKHRAAHPPKAPPTPKAPMINQDKAAECLALFARNGWNVHKAGALKECGIEILKHLALQKRVWDAAVENANGSKNPGKVALVGALAGVDYTADKQDKQATAAAELDGSDSDSD